MKKITNLCLTFILGGLLTCANAAIKVTPTLLELNANDARGNYLTTSFDIQGGKNETIRFKVYPEYFKITQNGTMENFETSEETDSLIKHVRFVPNEFTLQNGRTQKVRLTVANLKQLQDGESRMVLFLEDVAAKEIYLPSGKKDVTTKLIVKTRVGIPVYVDKGRFTKCANIENLNIKKENQELNIAYKLVSDGNSRVRFGGKGQIIKNKKLIGEYPIKNNVIGSKNILLAEDEIPLKDIKENGEYTLRLVLDYKDEKGKLKNIIKETTFTIDNIEESKI